MGMREKELKPQQKRFLLKLKNSKNKIDIWSFEKFKENLIKEGFEIDFLNDTN